MSTRIAAPSRKPTTIELEMVANAKEQHFISCSYGSTNSTYACKLYQDWCKEHRAPYIYLSKHQGGQKTDISIEYLPLVLTPAGAIAVWDVLLSEPFKKLQYEYSVSADSMRFIGLSHTRAQELAAALYLCIGPNLVTIHREIEQETNRTLRALHEQEQKHQEIKRLYRLARPAIERHYVYGTFADRRCSYYHAWCVLTHTPYIRLKKAPSYINIEINLIHPLPSTVQLIEKLMQSYSAVDLCNRNKTVTSHDRFSRCKECNYVKEYSMVRTGETIPDDIASELYSFAVSGKLLQSVMSSTEHQDA